MNKVIALVPAAGLGRRLKSDRRKAFVMYEGQPLICHTLTALSRSEFISHIVLALHEQDVSDWQKIDQQCQWKSLSVVVGGQTRAHSVVNAFEQAKKLSDDFFACVHDGARPFISSKLIKSVVEAAQETGASGCALPVTNTIKEIQDDGCLKTLDRRQLKSMQTPQIIHSKVFSQAINKWVDMGRPHLTDDLQFLEALNVRVVLVEGEKNNIKITYGDDLKKEGCAKST